MKEERKRLGSTCCWICTNVYLHLYPSTNRQTVSVWRERGCGMGIQIAMHESNWNLCNVYKTVFRASNRWMACLFWWSNNPLVLWNTSSSLLCPINPWVLMRPPKEIQPGGALFRWERKTHVQNSGVRQRSIWSRSKFNQSRFFDMRFGIKHRVAQTSLWQVLWNIWFPTGRWIFC